MGALICKQRVPIPGSDLMRWCGADAIEETENGPRCYHHAPPKPKHPNPQRTRAIIEAQKLSLTQQERRELAEMLVGHAGSWKSISEDDARRVADALKAYQIVQALILLRHHPKTRSRR